ncbi:MAG: hypothetical protein US52_C0003G0010 [candidate division WS6 bacterium GW2011_GWA2_37_6]|uniref:PEGA domain-containing protein n=1 Tax=candidate division WS6 bacterium GW2011_GWA2_37_6 TaxID=1619087 RepID=A0A0G0JHK9_9BACT|nr:MAG: hypothetical protein US52_C0003G0010 [candidate division WS6 bacterium GW2011_GWA2_37_6]
MFKRVFIGITIVIALAVLAVWSPWNSWNISVLGLLGLQNDDKYAGLQVYSTSGEVELKIDNEVVGNVTEEGSPLDIVEIEQGDHLIALRRVSEDQTANYYEFTRMINFVRGINTVLAYEIGPTEKFSGGYIIYATTGVEEKKSFLNIRTEPEGAKVYINEVEVSNAPLLNYELDLTKDYKVKIVKETSETIEFDLLPETDEEKELIKGYDLNVEVKLFEYPLEVREES